MLGGGGGQCKGSTSEVMVLVWGMGWEGRGCEEIWASGYRPRSPALASASASVPGAPTLPVNEHAENQTTHKDKHTPTQGAH